MEEWTEYLETGRQSNFLNLNKSVGSSVSQKRNSSLPDISFWGADYTTKTASKHSSLTIRKKDGMPNIN